MKIQLLNHFENKQEFNIYCDESCHLENDKTKSMGLGAIWCEKKHRKRIFQDLRDIKLKHGFKPYWELKWNGVSPQKINYYKDVLKYFFENDELFFRGVIVPDKNILSHSDYIQTHDEFYYKMYYVLFKQVLKSNIYHIHLDIKDTQGSEKLDTLKECLGKFNIYRIQLVRSNEIELIQLADFIIGALVYAHRGLKTSKAKVELAAYIDKNVARGIYETSAYQNRKFNILIWKSKKAKINGFITE